MFTYTRGRTAVAAAVALLLVAIAAAPARGQPDEGRRAPDEAVPPESGFAAAGQPSTMQASAAPRTGPGEWRLMLDGNAWLRYRFQDASNIGDPGATRVDFPGWVAGSVQRHLSGSSRIGFRGTISLDRTAFGRNVHPQYFSTGEMQANEAIVDRNPSNPHFGELALTYGHDLGELWGVYGYFGVRGKPAFGPPFYLHRPSALHLPDAPLGYLWQDATHLVYRTAAVGVRYDIFKLDGSVFAGRQAGDSRFGLYRPHFDSYSGRLSVSPTERWALQLSRAFLREPDALGPGQDQWHTSASILYVAPAPAGKGTWATAAIWGVNERLPQAAPEEKVTRVRALHAILLESDLQIGRHALYGRAEWVQTPAEELGFTDGKERDRRFDIRSLSLGFSREILDVGQFCVDVGGHATLFAVRSNIKSAQSNRPMSAQLYLRVRPLPARRGHR